MKKIILMLVFLVMLSTICLGDSRNMEMIKSYAEEGHSLSQNALAWEYFRGFEIDKDNQKALYWMEKAAAQDKYFRDDLDNLKGLISWENAAEQGNVEAMINMVRYWSPPLPDPITKKRRLYWLNRAAEAGHKDAQYALGLAYFWGTDGCNKNKVQSIYWLNKSSAQGKQEAEDLLDYIFELSYK